VGTLSPAAVEKLTEMRRELLQRQGRDFCDECSVCLIGDNYQLPTAMTLPHTNASEDGALVRLITQAVIKNLEGEVGE
jgi:hypothetical protein